MTSLFILLLVLLGGGCTILFIICVARNMEHRSWRASLVAFRLQLPRDLSAETVTSWFATLNAATHATPFSLLPPPPIVLEVRGSATDIEHYLLVPQQMRGAMLGHLQATMPGVRVTEAPEYLKHRPRYQVAAEAALSNHQRPMGTDRARVASSALLASLHPLYGQEEILVQYIITGGGIPRPIPSVAAAAHQSTLWNLDASVYPVESEAIRAAREKLKDPILKCTLRVGIAGTANRKRAYALFGNVFSALRVMNATGVGVVRQWWLPVGLVAQRLSARAVPLLSRWPLTLSTRELAGLSSLVVADIALPGLSVGSARQLPAVPVVPRSGAVLGTSDYPGMVERTIALHLRDRLAHTHIIGPTGTGKSTLLANLALQDIAAGLSVIIIDPKGDLVADICDRFPSDREPDLTVLDASKTGEPIIGFNPLAAPFDEHDREQVVDHVLGIFKDLYARFWGPRTDLILRSALHTAVSVRAANGDRLTLCEIPELLTNPSFRRSIIRQTLPLSLQQFWAWYEQLSPDAQLAAQGPVLNKIKAVTDRSAIRLMVGQSSGLDLSAVLNRGGVLLVNLAKGRLGEETAALLGSLLVASIWEATLRRENIPPEYRKAAIVTLDEFQDVLKLGTVGDMLAQSRGLAVGLQLAHQHLHQLPEAIAHDVLGTARSQVIFQLGYQDARSLAPAVAPSLTAHDLMGLEAHHAVVRPCVGGKTLAPLTLATLALPEATQDGIALAHACRERLGVARSDVEARLAARLQSSQHSPASFGRTAPGGAS